MVYFHTGWWKVHGVTGTGSFCLRNHYNTPWDHFIERWPRWWQWAISSGKRKPCSSFSLRPKWGKERFKKQQKNPTSFTARSASFSFLRKCPALVMGRHWVTRLRAKYKWNPEYNCLILLDFGRHPLQLEVGGATSVSRSYWTDSIPHLEISGANSGLHPQPLGQWSPV